LKIARVNVGGVGQKRLNLPRNEIWK